MKDIGKILKNARENKEYTQKQVMELTGIHRKSLSGYENNVAEPDLSTFATLANLYGISADNYGNVNRILLFLCFVLNSKFFLYLKNSMQSIRKNF
ncbi:MAG: helix-turn-helix domain-containing protein [Coprococcus comes]